MRTILLFATVLLAAVSAFAQANAPAGRPVASQGASPLSHDTHDGITVTVDPYTDASRSKQKFGKADPRPTGILPVEVYLRNETDQPIRVNLGTIQLSVHPKDGAHQDVDNLTVAEVAAILVHPEGAAEPHTRRFPIGIPTGGEDKKVDKLVEILQPLSLDADVLPPMGQIHGFLFFNLGHDISLVADSSVYIPDVTIIPSNKAVIFFEVPLYGKT